MPAWEEEEEEEDEEEEEEEERGVARKVMMMSCAYGAFCPAHEADQTNLSRARAS